MAGPKQERGKALSVTKYYEITCDHCGGAEHFQTDSIIEAEKQARAFGWIKTADHRYFDSLGCRKEFSKNRK